MTGTILNILSVVLGGLVGESSNRQPSPQVQQALKGLFGVGIVFVGLRTVVTSLGGGFWPVMKQLLIVILAMMVGHMVGRLLRIQRGVNKLGNYAGQLFAAALKDKPSFSDGFMTCTILLCVAPLGVLGAIQDGFDGRWHTLAIKSVLDGLAMLAYVRVFGRAAWLAVIPLAAYQGALTLGARAIAPALMQRNLLDSVNATSGFLVFTVALIILDFRRVRWADYLPSLIVAPLLAWWWQW